MEDQLYIESPDRNINIFNTIAPEMACSILKQIYEIEYFDSLLFEQNPEAKLTPIIVNIFSLGGDLFSCQALMDALLSLNAPVITRAYGAVESAGFILFLCGDVRVAGKNTTFMLHNLSYDVGLANMKVQKQEIKEFERMNLRMFKFVEARTNISMDEMERRFGEEMYYDYEEALNLNIVTDDITLNSVYNLFEGDDEIEQR